MNDSLQKWTEDYIDCQTRIVQLNADMKILPFADSPINVTVYFEIFTHSVDMLVNPSLFACWVIFHAFLLSVDFFKFTF